MSAFITNANVNNNISSDNNDNIEIVTNIAQNININATTTVTTINNQEIITTTDDIETITEEEEEEEENNIQCLTANNDGKTTPIQGNKDEDVSNKESHMIQLIQNDAEFVDLTESGKPSPTMSSSSASSSTTATSPNPNNINTINNNNSKKKRRVRFGALEADFEKSSIIVHYDVETFDEDDENLMRTSFDNNDNFSKFISIAKTTRESIKSTTEHHKKQIRIKNLKTITDFLPVAQKIVDKCKLIHSSKLAKVESLLKELQQRSIEKKVEKKNDDNTLEYISALNIYRRPNFRFLKSWSPGLYEGEANERGLPHGYGTLREGTGIDNDGKYFPIENDTSTRRIYVGQWENGLPSNYGTVTHGDSKKYDGFWLKGKPHGFGIETRSDGDIYRGEWINGKRQGFGVRYWPDGQRYGGQWVNGKMQGHGVFVWPSQLQYSGQWSEHKRNGYGYELHQQTDNNATYAGEWKKGKRHGIGVRIRSCGSTYRGLFTNGKRCKKKMSNNNNPPIDCSNEAIDITVQEVTKTNLNAQFANYKAEEITLKESLKVYLLKFNSDKRCVTSDELINVILDMINVVKSIPAGSLDSQEILKHGKSKREQLGKEIWNRKVAQHFGLLLKTLKQRKNLIQNNSTNILQVDRDNFDPETYVHAVNTVGTFNVVSV